MTKSEKKDIVLEDDNFFSIYDAAPVSKGHTIIIPKKHIISFFEIKPEFAKLLYQFIVKVKNKIDEKHHPDGYNIGINDGRSAGRSIDHLHIHLIPRYNEDIKEPRGGIRNIFGKYTPPEQPPEDF